MVCCWRVVGLLFVVWLQLGSKSQNHEYYWDLSVNMLAWVKPANISWSTAQQTRLTPPRLQISFPPVCLRNSQQTLQLSASRRGTTAMAACFLALWKRKNNAMNHRQKIRSRRWILCAPPSLNPPSAPPLLLLGKQHAQRTDRRPLMRKIINKAINRALCC